MILYIVIVLFLSPATSALGYWTWISGDSTPGSPGVLKTADNPSAVRPGARESPLEIIHAATDMLVMFGGISVITDTSTFVVVAVGDLWTYDIDRGIWNCTKGNTDRLTPFSLFGGVLDSYHLSNTPPGRFGHAISVISTTGDLLLYGGWANVGALNDLWQFSFDLNQWKLLCGSSAGNLPGIYGTQGISNANNIPGSRRFATMKYSPFLDDCVVFGGYGMDSNANATWGGLNDLWRFSMTSKRWTWIKGTSLKSQAQEVITTRNYHTNNSIGANVRHSGLLQPGTGNLIITASNSVGFILWSFDFIINAWAVLFLSPSRSASYGVINQPSTDIWPGASEFAAIEFLPDGKTMLFVAGNTVKEGVLVRSNDLWSFNMTSSEWTFIFGSQTNPALPNYGIKGVADSTNIPGGRLAHGLAYDSVRKKLFLRGGTGDFNREGSSDIRLNDLWAYSLTDLPVNVPSSKTSATAASWHSAVSQPSFIASTNTIASSLLTLVIKNIIWIAVAVTAIIVIFVAACFKMAFKGKKGRKTTSREPTTMTVSDSIYSDSMSTVSNTETGSTTMVGTEMAFSVPGFLSFKDGIEFRADRKLASGGEGDVYLGTAFAAKLHAYGNTIVVKRIRESSTDPDALARFLQEVSITSYLQSCRNIVRMVGYCDTPLSILLKYYPIGSLKGFILSKERAILHSMLISFCMDISKGIQVMHNAGLAHCDLKPDNILIDIDSKSKAFYCVLTDFGIACVLDAKVLKVQALKVANSLGLSPAYAAPEIFVFFKTRKVMRRYQGDVYAIGMIIYEIMNRRRSYEST